MKLLLIYTNMSTEAETTERKRVALFSVAYRPFIGGAEVAVEETVKRLPQYEFDIFTARLDKKLPVSQQIGRANIHRLGTGHALWDKWLYPWRAARLASRLHHQNPYHLIHAVLETYAGLGAALFKKRVQGLPYVLTLQSGDSSAFMWLRTWFWYPLYRRVFTTASRITAISNFLANRAKAHGYRGVIDIIPNGVDTDHFSGRMNAEERVFIRKSWGMNENDFIIVTASRLVPKNGIDILIDSLEHLGDDTRLVIAGSGEDEVKLKERAVKFGQRVLFLGHIDHEQLPRVLKTADVFCRPSRSEGLGNVFLEAMAVGLAVVATPVGGIVDIVKDNETGLLAQPANPASVAEKIQAIRADSALRSRLVENGLRLSQSYGWDKIAAQYGLVYEEAAV